MKALLALAAVVAGIAAAPTALGSNFITENSASQNQANLRQAQRQHTQSYPSFITENSASQNQANLRQAQRAHAQSYPSFITENSASQNQANAAQSRLYPPSTVTVVAPAGFQWSDAGIGAGAAVGAMLLVLGATVVLLRRRGRLALA